MNPEEEKTIPVQAADADLHQTATVPTPEQPGASDFHAQDSLQNPNAADGAGMNAGYHADTDRTNAQYTSAQNYQPNPNAQSGAGMNTGYHAGANQANAQFNGAQGYQSNPNVQFGPGMNNGYHAGANQANAQFNGAQGYQPNPNAQSGAGMNTGYPAGANPANTSFNGAPGYQQNPNAQFNNTQGYPQNPNAQFNTRQGYPQNPNTQFGAGMNQNNAPYGSAPSFTQSFQNTADGTGMNAGFNAGANQANAQFNGAQGYQQNPNAQFGAGMNQNSAQYGNAQGYQNPYYVNYSAIPNAAPAKKKSMKKIWIPIVSVVLVAAIAVGVYFLIPKKTRNPEEAVTTAMSNTFSLERTSSTAGWLHSQELDTLTLDGAFQVNMDLTIDELSGSLASEISMLEGLGISTTTMLDKDAERLAAIASILYDGTSYLDYEWYAYDDYIAIACPSLFEGYIEFQSSNFGVDFNNSPLAEALNTTVDPTLAFRFFELFDTVQETEAEIPREVQDFLDSIRYEEGGKKDLQVNGRTQTCQGYNIVVTHESMERLAEWFCDYAASLGTPIEYNEIALLLPREDFVMTVYVDNKGRMARFSFDFPLDYAQTELGCQIDFTGLNDRPADHITGEFKINVGGYAYGFTFESITESAGTTETQNTTMSIDISGISIANATYRSTFDTRTGNGSMDLSVSAMYTSLLSMNLDYSYTDVVPGESYTVNLDDLTLDMAGELRVSLSGSASVSRLNGSISEPSGTKYDLFTMTADDVLSLGEEINQNALNGPLSFLFAELYGGYYLPDNDDWY